MAYCISRVLGKIEGQYQMDFQLILQCLHPLQLSVRELENSEAMNLTSCISNVEPNVQILLCTVIIRVRDCWDNYQTCRFLLDCGSQTSLITSQCFGKLGLNKQNASIQISFLGSSDTRTNGIPEIQFITHFPSEKSSIAPEYVVNKIVGMLPHHDLDSLNSELFKDITLANPTF